MQSVSASLQELLRIPVRHPKLLAVLKADDPKRVGVTSLAAFNARVWHMTGMPLRYFQEVAFWLLQHTAALEMQDGRQRAGGCVDACTMAGPTSADGKYLLRAYWSQR